MCFIQDEAAGEPELTAADSVGRSAGQAEGTGLLQNGAKEPCTRLPTKFILEASGSSQDSVRIPTPLLGNSRSPSAINNLRYKQHVSQGEGAGSVRLLQIAPPCVVRELALGI